MLYGDNSSNALCARFTQRHDLDLPEKVAASGVPAEVETEAAALVEKIAKLSLQGLQFRAAIPWAEERPVGSLGRPLDYQHAAISASNGG